MPHLIFVYGTLRQGGSRPIPRLFPAARFVGFGSVRGWLYHFGAYPGLICDAAGRDVLGEVYAVDAAAVREMDEIERYVEGDAAECYYFRCEHRIAMRDGDTLTAELYEVNPRFYDCSTPMDAGDWIAWAQAQPDLPAEELWPDGTPVKKMIIAQISDSHITTAGGEVDRLFETASHLRRAVAHLNQLPSRPDAVIFTGDCVNGGSGGYENEYVRFRELIAPLTMPVYVAPGNHDSREHLRAFIDPHAKQVMPNFIQYVIDDWPVRLIALDTHVPSSGAGKLCAERLAWLEARLAETPARPTLLFMHHPPFATYLQPLDAIGLDGADALGAIVARYSNVERIVAGHVHRAIQRRFHGTLAMTCPSTAHQFVLDFEQPNQFVAVMEPPVCLLHVWHESGGLVTHTSVIGDYGPAIALD